MTSLDEFIDISWAQFAALTQAPPEPARAADDHECGYACQHVVADADGSFVCRLSGVVFGKQLCNGPLDSRLMENRPYFPRKRRRVVPTATPYEELFSTTLQTVTKLLDASRRRQTEHDRLVKSLKTAVRRAPGARAGEPCALRLLYKLFAEVERGGALTVVRAATQAQIEAVAGLVTNLHSVLLSPYSKVNTHRPTTAYYVVAMCYLLSTETLGKKLHVPLLAALLPEEKCLKHLDFSVTRMTAAKRYVLGAVKHYVDS